jgi:glycosyltransferase involved in cell wall biosynthesis
MTLSSGAGAPQVSVVMGAYNAADSLRESLASVLSQRDLDLEFVVVNDGSTDATRSILEDCAKQDDRLRVLHQDNRGLTQALIRGCSEARGEFIARQDAGGDVSLPGRFGAQAKVLAAHPDAVMVSCGTRFLGPGREVLYEIVQSTEELHAGLDRLDLATIRGPSSHPSTMFRKTAYDRVGGYRSRFAVGQDLDLWLRLAEIGACLAMPEVLYETRVELHSISSLRRVSQIDAARLAIDCARRRRKGGSDETLLTGDPPRPRSGRPSGLARARYYYFLASVLRHRDTTAARAYYRKALSAFPLHLKALVGYLRT